MSTDSEVALRAAEIVRRIRSKSGQSVVRTPWSLRRSKLEPAVVVEIESRASCAFESLFGDGHSGLVFVNHQVEVQQQAHERLNLSFEYWVSSFCEAGGERSHVASELCEVRDDFGKCICFLGHYCRRVGSLFNAITALISHSLWLDEAGNPQLAMTVLDFVEHVFLAGMVPLGIEATDSGKSLQVFVCD